MTKKTSSGYTPLSLFYRCPRLMQGLSLIGGLSLLSSSSLVVAQSDSSADTVVVPNASTAPTAPPTARPKPTAPERSPDVIIVPSSPAPRRTSAREASAPESAPVRRRTPVREVSPPESAPVPTRRLATPEAGTSAPVVRQKPVLSAPNLAQPESSTLAKPPKVIFSPSQTEETAKTPGAPNHSFIDPTDYSIGATTRNEGPAQVILTERSTGCRAVSQNGRLASGICGVGMPSRQPIARSGQRSTTSATLQAPNSNIVAGRQLASPSVVGAVVSAVPVQLGSLTVVAPNNRPASFRPTRHAGGYSTVSPASLPGHISYAIPAQGQSPSGLDYFDLSQRPVGRPSLGQDTFMFPLSIPAAITSLFGWRIHPISGDYRFHAGTDLGAPQGTPVLAAVSGQVVTADYLGGYGLTVILQHEQGTQESLYGHLSQVFVHPGDMVEQGSVIALVGSTGNSTGPHLHFEWRYQTANGWVPVDAGPHLKYALAQFIQALQVAQATSPRGL
ncbi:MAG TPA: peptidoglycan DD-metalloendopeptidase family protein [Cyanophyceae cyanobacterium]